MLSVCGSASSTDGALSTTVNYRLAVPGSATSDDALQQQAIVQASRWAERFIGVPPYGLFVQTYSETLPAYGGQTLMLSRRPVLNLLMLMNGATSTASNSTVYDSTDVRIDHEAAFLWRDQGFSWTAQMPWVLGPAVPPDSELETWYTEYAAGYIGPGGTTATCFTCSTSTGRTLPEDLELGVILKAREIYEGVYALNSEKVGDLSVSYASEGYGRAAERVLEPYRRTWIVR